MSPAPRIFSRIAIALLALTLATALRAQTPATTETDSVASPGMGPAKLIPPSPQREHLLSDETSANIASSMPKYLPPKPIASAASGEPSDLRDTDKPRNGIIRLPKYIVNRPKEPKPPVFSERQMLTPKGLVELAMKRNPGLHFGNIFGWNEGIALVMYAEQERLDNLAGMADDVRISRDFGDNAAADALAAERVRLAYRQSDIGGRPSASGH